MQLKHATQSLKNRFDALVSQKKPTGTRSALSPLNCSLFHRQFAQGRSNSPRARNPSENRARACCAADYVDARRSQIVCVVLQRSRCCARSGFSNSSERGVQRGCVVKRSSIQRGCVVIERGRTCRIRVRRRRAHRRTAAPEIVAATGSTRNRSATTDHYAARSRSGNERGGALEARAADGTLGGGG